MIQLIALLFVISAGAFGMDWQGHRGARGLYPENTIGAMEVALKYPVTTLEFDVVLSKDHKVIVSHEPWMHEDICLDPSGKRVKGKKHNLYKMTADEIQKYDCGSLPHIRFRAQKNIKEKKPLLSDLLKVTEEKNKAILYNIEIKSTLQDEASGYQPDIKTFSDVVLRTILEKIPASRFTVQSFDWRVLQYIKKAYPEVKLSALFDGKIFPKDVEKGLGFKPDIFSPYFKYLSKKDVDAFHAMGIKVVPWTVNDEDDMKTMISIGVDGIITDYPDRITKTGSSQTEK